MPPPPRSVPRPFVPTAAETSALSEYLATGVCTLAKDHLAPVYGVTFLRQKTTTKCNVITDLRPLNSLRGEKVRLTLPGGRELPPQAACPRLPNIADILVHLRDSDPSMYFTTIDLSRYFDSIPVVFDPPLRVSFANRVVKWQRLPFGWSVAPSIAQWISCSLVDDAMRQFSLVKPFVYLDDILLACHDRTTLTNATLALARALENVGLRINRDKCVLTPTRTIHYLGHRLHNRCAVCITPLPRLPPSNITAKVLRRHVAVLQWIFPQVRHYLHPTRQYLTQCTNEHSPRDIPPAIKQNLESAAHLCARGRFKRPQPFTAPGPELQQHHRWFVDAAACHGRAALTIYNADNKLLHTFPFRLPTYIPRTQRGQQAAELYALVYALKRAATLRQPVTHICTDSETALASVARCRGDIDGIGRARLLQWTARTLRQLATRDLRVCLGYIPSTDNPADGPSRHRRAPEWCDARNVRAWQANRPITC